MHLATVAVNGVEAAYRTAGEGEPVLYLHGFPTSGYLWRKVTAEVAREFRTIAPDFPGFGDSELMNGPHTWEALVAWLDAFVGTLGVAPVHLAVHDWGGLIGLAWACLHPGQVRSLLITDTSFRSRDRWHGLAEQWRTPGAGEELIGSLTEEGFANLLGAQGAVEPESVAEYWKGMATQERRAAKLEMYRSLDFEMFAPLEPILPRVAPGRVRVVWGELDPFLPVKVAFRFGERLGADVTILEGTGHFLQESRGEDLGRLHLEFLR